MVLAFKSNFSPVRHFLLKCSSYLLFVWLSSAVWSFTRINQRNFEISWNLYKKGIHYTYQTGLMQANLLLYGYFRKVFITHSISEGNQTRYILPCCMEIWCCAKLGTTGNPRNSGINSTLINYCTENVIKESIYNFVLIAEQGAAEIWFRAKTIVTPLSRDIYSDCPKTTIMIKFSLCVIHVL